jgi:putative copper export protein
MLVDGLSVALRALSFVALFQAAGAATFLAFFGRLLPTTKGAVRRVGACSALFAIGLLLAQYLLEAARMSGELSGVMDSTLQALVLHSSTATTLAWRLGGLTLILIALRSSGVASSMLSMPGVLLVIGAFALMGHTASHPERWLLCLLLIAHLLVVTFWFGALVPLHLASSREAPMKAATAINTFSAVALWIVPVLLVAGVALAALLLPTSRRFDHLSPAPDRQARRLRPAHGPCRPQQIAPGAGGCIRRWAGGRRIPSFARGRILADRRRVERDGRTHQLLLARLTRYICLLHALGGEDTP